MYRRARFVRANVAWLSATLLVLVVLDAFSFELLFVLGFNGLLLVTELTSPFAATPAWRRRLRWLLVPGLLGFAYLFVRRLLAILPAGVF